MKTILEQIKEDYKEYEVVVKSKEARELVEMPYTKKEDGFATMRYFTGLKYNKHCSKVLDVQTYQNGNARVTVGKFLHPLTNN